MTKKLFFLKGLFLFFFLQNFSVQAQPEVTQKLQQILTEKGEGEYIPLNIRLVSQYDSDLLYRLSREINEPEERRRFVVNELKQFSKENQKELLSFLYEMQKADLVKDVRPLWIGNLINCKARPEVIRELTSRKDLARLDYNITRQILHSWQDTSSPAGAPDLSESSGTPAWNVSLVNADQVWQQGYTGQNVVVAVMDTGVNYEHQDIENNMWQHDDFPNHGYNFAFDDHNTMDFEGHGTHVAGTVAGTGTAGTATGVAPGVRIMNLQVLNDNGGGNEAHTWQAIEFAVEYGAHVMNLSLGWRHNWGPDRAMWRTAMDNALSAGVIAAVASGNIPWFGGQPPPNEVHTPGDIPPPWLHPDQSQTGSISAVVSVGATTNTSALADFSCKGPVTWQNVNYYNDYEYQPGMGLLRPDLVAPGAAVISLLHSDTGGYTTKSGTSMATPAVAGVMALMLSKNPDLLPEDISRILEQSATGNGSKDNSFGSGLLNALEAVNQTPNMFVRYVDHQVNDSQGNDDGYINAGEQISLGITVRNRTINQVDDVVAILSVDSEFVSITDSIVSMGDFQPGHEINFQDAFTFQVAENIPGNYHIKFTISCYSQSDPEDIWESSFTEMAHAPYLHYSQMQISTAEPATRDNLLIPGEVSDVRIVLTNTGQTPSGEIQASVSYEGQWIMVVSQEPQIVPSLAAGEQAELFFQVASYSEVPAGTLTDLDFYAVTQVYEFIQTKEVLIGEVPTYSGRDLPSTYMANVTIESNSLDPGVLTVTIPQNAVITGVDVEYPMTSRSGALVNVQRSFIRCVSEGGITEQQVYSVPADTAGTVHYRRTGLDIANGVQGGGDIVFELHAFRSWGGSGSGTQFVFVPDNAWTVIVHYELPYHEITFRVSNQTGELIEGAELEVNENAFTTNTQGEASINIPKGMHFFSASALKHHPVQQQLIQIEGNNIVDIEMTRWFDVTFNISDTEGSPVADAVIIFDDDFLLPGEYYVDELAEGSYHFSVEADGFLPYNGEVEIIDQDILVDITLQSESTSVNDNSTSEIRVFPNPASSVVVVQSNDNLVYLQLLNIRGQEVLSVQVNGNTVELDAGSLDPGLYILKINTGSGSVTKRLVVGK